VKQEKAAMPLLELLHTKTFDAAMERLRREFSDQEWPNGGSADEFDPVSSHVVVSVDGELAGMVRLTRRPPSVLAAWAVGEIHLPGGRNAVEAGRSVVARRWRGMGLYKLLMSEATCLCHRLDAPQVVAGVELGFPLRAFLERIGFRCVGEPILFRVPPNGEVVGQVIVQDPAAALAAALGARESCVRRLTAAGFSVHSSVLHEAAFA
jgi:predicted GNAT family N-acyltransferase